MKFFLPVFILLACSHRAYSQDYEFPKGWVLNAEFFNGFTSSFYAAPELFATELRLTPQYTVVPKLLRIGASAGFQYNNKKASGLFGPGLAFKLKTVNVKKLNSSIINLQWVAEHLWGTNGQKLIGTGCKVEAGQLVLVSLTGYRDYGLRNWLINFGIGLQLLKHKVPEL